MTNSQSKDKYMFLGHYQRIAISQLNNNSSPLDYCKNLDLDNPSKYRLEWYKLMIHWRLCKSIKVHLPDNVIYHILKFSNIFDICKTFVRVNSRWNKAWSFTNRTIITKDQEFTLEQDKPITPEFLKRCSRSITWSQVFTIINSRSTWV